MTDDMMNLRTLVEKTPDAGAWIGGVACSEGGCRPAKRLRFTARYTESKLTARGFGTGSNFPSPLDTAISAAPVIDGVCRLIANHHDLAIFESAPEVRALSSASITRLQRSYGPVRLPPWPPPFATSRPLPSPLTGLPRLPEPPFRRAVPTTPADRAGARVDCFPAHAAFPF